MSGYRLIKQVSSDPSKFKSMDDVGELQRFYDRTPQTKEDKLTHLVIKTCNTFGSTGRGDIYKPSNPYNKLKNIQEYKDRMKNTTILSQDYKAVLKTYDSSNTLFYLDPPYEKSDELYKNTGMDYEAMNSLLGSIKGKFILSINDSSNIRSIFKGFKMKRITVKTQGNKGIGTGADRTELLIMNY